MSKAKTAVTEFVPGSVTTIPSEELLLRVEASIFGMCDMLGWPRDLEAFAEKIKQHPAVQDFVPHKDDPILTLQVAGELVGRSGQTIRNWITEGYVESEMDPSGMMRVRRSKLLRFFQGTALASPWTVQSMTDEQKAQYNVDTQLNWAKIYCRYCNKLIHESTTQPAQWLKAHSLSCNAETYAESLKPKQE